MVVGKDQREGKRAGNRYDYKALDVRVKHGGQEEMRQVTSSMLDAVRLELTDLPNPKKILPLEVVFY